MFYTLLENRSVISLTGEDTIDFLQGLISNDARKLLKGEAIYAAMLSPQGKFLHDFFLIKSGDKIFIDVASSRKNDLLSRLKLYRLRSKVEIEDATTLSASALFGKDDNGEKLPPEAIITYQDPRTEKMGFRLISSNNPIIKSSYNLYEKLRLYLTIPDTVDMIIDKSLLLECGFEKLYGVDFSKGCYVGQEVTARSKFRGQVRKSFYQISADANIKLPQLGTPIIAGENVIGELRSSCENIGIAIINIEALTAAQAEDKKLSFYGINVKIVTPSWL